jgi:putative redox protein
MAGFSERLDFPGHDGSRLAARLELPPGPPRAYAVFAHCFTCSKDIFAATRIAQALAGRGFAVLRFDFTGLGASEGEFANTNFSSNVADLVAAADHLRATRAAARRYWPRQARFRRRAPSSRWARQRTPRTL